MATALVPKLVWLAVGVGIAWLAVGIGIGTFGEPGAGMISFALGVLIAIIALGGIVAAVVTGRTGEPVEAWTQPMVLRIGAVVILLAAYVMLFERIGFLVLTALLLALLFAGFGGVRWRWAVPLAVALSVANYALFKLALGTQLPAGILG